MNLNFIKHPGMAVNLYSRSKIMAFTMVEVAIALAVVAFAMIALIGILPAGLRVQKENREDSIIAYDAGLIMEAIRTGAMGMDDLVNYVDWLEISNSYKYVKVEAKDIVTGRELVGLLSMPRLIPSPANNREIITNYIRAKFRAINGVASEKSQDLKDFSFSYIVESSISPLNLLPPVYTNFSVVNTNSYEYLPRSNNWARAVNMIPYNYSLRLDFRWPVRPDGSTGPFHRSFSTVISGRYELLSINPSLHGNYDLWFFRPLNYSK